MKLAISVMLNRNLPYEKLIRVLDLCSEILGAGEPCKECEDKNLCLTLYYLWLDRFESKLKTQYQQKK